MYYNYRKWTLKLSIKLSVFYIQTSNQASKFGLMNHMTVSVQNLFVQITLAADCIVNCCRKKVVKFCLLHLSGTNYKLFYSIHLCKIKVIYVTLFTGIVSMYKWQ